MPTALVALAIAVALSGCGQDEAASANPSGDCFATSRPTLGPGGPSSLGQAPGTLLEAQRWAARNRTWVAGVVSLDAHRVAVGVTRDGCAARRELGALLPGTRVVVVHAARDVAALARVKTAVTAAMRSDPEIAALHIADVIPAYDGKLIVSLALGHPDPRRVARVLAAKFTAGDTSWFFPAAAGP